MVFQLVQEVQRLQRGQCLNVYIVEFFDDLAGYAGVVVSLDGVKIELHRVIASRCAGLQLAQHGVGALCHAAGQTRELRDLDAVAVVGGACHNAAQKRDVLAALFDGDIIVFDAVNILFHARQLVVVRGEQRLAADVLADKFYHTARNAHAVKRRSAAANFIQND